ncbi:MAG: hypothetical protein ACRYFS_24420 [Janthinobacterium lividum]
MLRFFPLLLTACLLTGCSSPPPPAVVIAPRPAVPVPQAPAMPAPVVLSADHPNTEVKSYSAKDHPPIHADYHSVLPPDQPTLSPGAQQEERMQSQQANLQAERAVLQSQRSGE